MKTSNKLIGIGIACLFLIIGFSGCVKQPEPGKNIIVISALSTGLSNNPKYVLASHYSSVELTINSQVPQYTLPLNLGTITNLNTVNGVLNLTDEQKTLLETNGFFVKGFGSENNIVAPYTYLKMNNIPIFITSDTLLHLYHIQFDQILKGIEQREFFPKILLLSKAIFDQSVQDYQSVTDPILKEAARRNIAFFGVGLSLLQTPSEGYNESEQIPTVSFSIPDYTRDNVTTELSYINAHDGYHNSTIFHYNEDYSQYTPRGHYTQSEILKRYFKAMMWYGRMTFLMKGGHPNCPACDFLISAEDAKIQIIQAILISTSLSSATINNESANDIWTRIYAVTSFFVGTADDLTPYEYLTSIQQVYGSQFNTTMLTNASKLFELKLQLSMLRYPQIYGGTGQVVINKPLGNFTVDDLNILLEKTKGMRFMGQRFIPDSYMFQQLVLPSVGRYTGNDTPFTKENTQAGPMRCFSRGLDVMAALGSKRALDILKQEGDTDYKNYTQQLTKLQENFSSLNTTEWNRNLYFSWMYTLTSLLKEYNGSGYPSFMQTSAWADKELHTSLASWTELRHDTILYAKQSYTPIATGIQEPPQPVVGYVEPVPEFYSRILALTTMTKEGLTDLHALNETETGRLQNLQIILQRLLNISVMELQGNELTEDDYEFIRNFGGQLDGIVTDVNDKGKETTLIADVHTDGNTNQVLEEGVGYVNLMVVAYKVPNGRVILGAGPVFSYYEFKQPINNRLTDEQWIQQLENGQQPDQPAWTSSFIAD